MSVPANEMGSVGTSDNTATSAQPTSATTPPTGTANPSSWLSGLVSNLNPFSGSSFLPNAALVAVGIILAIAALIGSQKENIITVAKTAAETGVV